MRSRLTVLALSLLGLTAAWTPSALNPPQASAKWALCIFQVFGNYEYGLYPFCYRVDPGTGIAERASLSAKEPASSNATGTIELKNLIPSVSVTCEVKDTSEFYNEENVGKGSVTKYAFSECAIPKLSKCTVSIQAESLPYATQQSITKEEFFVLVKGMDLVVTVEGALCALEGEYEVTGNLKGVWGNTETNQLVFPTSPMEGSTLVGNENEVVMSGAETFEGIEGDTVEAVLP